MATKKTKKKARANRRLTVSSAAQKVSKLSKLGVQASIVPDAAGTFRIEVKASKKAAKKKAPKKAAKKRPRKKATKKATKKASRRR